MTNLDCEKWISITDAAVLGEPVTTAEREFEVSHRLRCGRCRAEAEVWASLRPSRLHVLPSAREIDDILDQVPQRVLPMERRPSHAPAAFVSIVGVGLATLALAAGVFFWLKPSDGGLAPTAQQASAHLPAPTASNVELGLTRATLPGVGPRYFAEDTCAELANGITWCVAAGSEIAAMDFSSPARVVHLVRGRATASLVAQPAGASFTIATKDGSVTAVAGKFAVEIAAHGGTSARVHDGDAVVRALSPERENFLVAGLAGQLGSGAVQPVAQGDRERDLRLLLSVASAPVSAP